MLGGSGLVGSSIARRLIEFEPSRLVMAALREDEATEAVEELRAFPTAAGVDLVAEWGDVFLRAAHGNRRRADLLSSERTRREILDDLFGPLDDEAYRRSHLFSLIVKHAPDLVIDCINTATAIAYQDLFASATRLRRELDGADSVPGPAVEAHLSTLYLPQLIRHVQFLLKGMRRVGTKVYVKIGTSGTGGMGLNVPFTHSEERPSPTLLSKASVAGAHSALLFLMGRTPDAPVVIEIKPTAAIAWKSIRYGPVLRGGQPIPRYDSRTPVALQEAFGPEAAAGATRLDGVLESVVLDAGENGLFSLCEFETISSLGMMEFVTPEEIADATIAEIQGRPTGRDIVGALDASTFGPTYRGGSLREVALRTMEKLEEEHGVRSIAFEMLGPPRLSKLLFEAFILGRLFPGGVREAAGLDPEDTARAAAALVREDGRLRSDILSVGLPILLEDGKRMLRGPRVSVAPDDLSAPPDAEWANRGWVDLRAVSWERWRHRCGRYVTEILEAPGPEAGSAEDLDARARSGEIRPGALGAFVFRVEDKGERMKR